MLRTSRFRHADTVGDTVFGNAVAKSKCQPKTFCIIAVTNLCFHTLHVLRSYL